MSSGGTIDRMLDRIPGYGGYRDKERRRDSDRAIRDNLALEYGQLADQLSRLARRLADERQISAVGLVDKPHKRLQGFIDRVRTASYGYAPLFSETEVDAAALDQLAAFDRALSDQRDTLATQISHLESEDPKSDEFKQHAQSIQETIQGLDDRFDKRNDVLQSGKPSQDQDVLALLNPPSRVGTPLVYRMHEGEALAYRGNNYTVVARVSAESNERSTRAFQLRGGDDNSWILASTDDASTVHWLTRVEIPASTTGSDMTIADQTYTVERQISGTGEVIGRGGSALKQPVKLLQYQSAEGHVLNVFDWGSSQLSLVGVLVDQAEIDVFTREV